MRERIRRTVIGPPPGTSAKVLMRMWPFFALPWFGFAALTTWLNDFPSDWPGCVAYAAFMGAFLAWLVWPGNPVRDPRRK